MQKEDIEKQEQEINALNTSIPTNSVISKDDFSYYTHPDVLSRLAGKPPDTLQPSDMRSISGMTSLVFDIIENINKESSLTPKEALKIPHDKLEGLYGLGFSLYENGKYDDAINIFRLLMMIDKFDYRFAFGLAACFQLAEKPLEAATTYMIASTLDPKNPMPHFHSSECYTSLKEPTSICISLGLCIKTIGDRKEYEALKLRCELLKDKITKKIKSTSKKNKLKKTKKGKK
jgi:type III secretion system low calcium response chaperone LcrH/SycD